MMNSSFTIPLKPTETEYSKTLTGLPAARRFAGGQVAGEASATAKSPTRRSRWPFRGRMSYELGDQWSSPCPKTGGKQI